MNNLNIGDQLYALVSATKSALFEQGELAQLTYGAYDVVANNVSTISEETIDINVPVGLKADRTALHSTKSYRKEDLIQRYQYLAFHQLPLNGLVQLVTIVEAMFGDVIRAIVSRHPHKLGAKRTVSLQLVLEAHSIEDVHIRATDALINELSYKSPSEFAEAAQPFLSLNLLE